VGCLQGAGERDKTWRYVRGSGNGFLDRWAIEAYSWEHSLHEDRLKITGMSDHNRVLVVAFTLRDHETIRIISARRTKRNEEQAYEENL
jgi:uncharacterized DUF497 family protein